MPYTPPGTLVAAQRSSSADRNHHRSRSFTDEPGPGAFAPIVGLPRRNQSHIVRPPTPKVTLPVVGVVAPAALAPPKAAPKFNLHGGSGSSEDSDEDDDAPRVKSFDELEAEADQDAEPSPDALAAKVVGAAGTTTSPPPELIPFPTLTTTGMMLSPIVTAPTPITRSCSTPQIQSPSMEDSPSIYRSPYSSLRSDPNTKNRTPLKPALKSNHSSPHLPSLAHQRALTQSAPSTPNFFKSAWSNGGSPASSAPGSPGGSIYSVPQTPKQVHFASEKSHLESVVVFTKGTRPRSLSNPGGNDTETETEGYDSSGPSWARPGRYPFPVMPKDQEVIQLDETRSSEVPFKAATGSNGFAANGDRQWILMETMNLPGTRPPTLRGSVLVRNVAFQKRVAVRFTLDDWQTTSEVSCNYSASLPSLPPPFSSTHGPGSSPMGGHSKSASMSAIPSPGGSSSTINQPTANGKGDSWDRFTFTIKLEDVERSLPNKKIFLVARYQLPSQWGWETGGEWWDNNEMRNYELAFKVGKKATVSGGSEEISPAALSARLNASIHARAASESAARTQSLPPLPPPGPVRSSTAGKLSPSSSALGLKINKPVLPPLSTNAPLKLRAGRGPTFAELPGARNSPPGSPVRGSPTRGTLYQPPLPGTVPGITHGVTQPTMPEEKKLTVAIPEPTPTGSPTIGTVGKKRGLSLSNYVAPKSPSAFSITSPTTHTGNSFQNLSSLVNGGDGGENAYTSSPSSSLRIVGGMPATMMEEDPASRQAAAARVPSWDTPLTGFWTALGGGVPGKAVIPPNPSTEDSVVEEMMLPTPPESSADSTLSTPDLERSPEQEQVTFGSNKEDAPEGRDTPTPTLPVEPVATSTVPFPSSSPVISTPFRTTSPPVQYSSDDAATTRPAQYSPLILTPNDSDEEEGPPALSSLGRRTSSQTGMMMKLDLPARPVFKIASPPQSGSDESSATATGKSKKTSSPKRGSSPVSPALAAAPQGLGLNVTSPAGGPPPEFLAKYCFFVSSPGASPPTSGSSSAMVSPSMMTALGGAGIDTPRASSPGLANAAAAWWGYSVTSSPAVINERDGITTGARGI